MAKLGRVGAGADNGKGRRREELASYSFSGHDSVGDCGAMLMTNWESADWSVMEWLLMPREALRH